MYQLDINCDSTTIEQAEKILEEMGIDISIAIQIMLKRVIKEQTGMFLIKPNNGEPIKQNDSKPNCSGLFITNKGENSMVYEKSPKMTKNKAISLFKQKGYDFSGNTTFASKNRTINTYWANPGFVFLEEKWNLILNDWINNVLYLFVIPKGEISADSLVGRNDKEEIIDLEIMYEDNTFTDSRSKISFYRFLTDTIQY